MDSVEDKTLHSVRHSERIVALALLAALIAATGWLSSCASSRDAENEGDESSRLTEEERDPKSRNVDGTERSDVVRSALAREFDGVSVRTRLLVHLLKRRTPVPEGADGWRVWSDPDGERYVLRFRWDDSERDGPEFLWRVEDADLEPRNDVASTILERDVRPIAYSCLDGQTYRRGGASFADRWSSRTLRGVRTNDRLKTSVRTLDRMLSRPALVEAATRVVHAEMKSGQTIAECKSERECRWKIEPGVEEGVQVAYVVDTEDGSIRLSWRAGEDGEALYPQDAWTRTIHVLMSPSGDLGLSLVGEEAANPEALGVVRPDETAHTCRPSRSPRRTSERSRDPRGRRGQTSSSRSSEGDDDISRQAVKRTMSSNMSEFAKCFGNAIDRNHVFVSFTIQPDGSVSDVEVQFGASTSISDDRKHDIETCIEKQFDAMTFPDPPADPKPVKYPLSTDA